MNILINIPIWCYFVIAAPSFTAGMVLVYFITREYIAGLEAALLEDIKPIISSETDAEWMARMVREAGKETPSHKDIARKLMGDL